MKCKCGHNWKEHYETEEYHSYYHIVGRHEMVLPAKIKVWKCNKCDLSDTN